MKNIFNRLLFYFNLMACHFLFFLYQTDSYPVVKYGNNGAAWWIPSQLIKNDSVMYSGGVGLDISFELALIKEFNLKVFAFDPTPKSRTYIKRFNSVSKLKYYPWGLWSENKTLKFFTPTNKNDVSHSVLNLQNTTTFFKAECKNIKSIMKRLKHSRVDILKIDIEGAEYAVVESLLKERIYPKIICLEFDHPTTIFKIWALIEKLYQNHYAPTKQDYFNFTFVRK